MSDCVSRSLPIADLVGGGSAQAVVTLVVAALRMGAGGDPPFVVTARRLAIPA